MIISNEVNEPLENVMAHHGVKGMKWGVRKKRGAHPSKTEIRTARKNVNKEKSAIRGQKAVVRSRKTKEGRQRQQAKLADMKAAHLRNPDRETAMKLTKGETAVAALLLLHPRTAPTAAAALITNEVGARVARRQRNKS